jgi:hypothetical protein
LHFGKTEIFLQRGLDRFLLICPSGKSNSPSGNRSREWIELSAKPVAVVQNMMGIASSFLLPPSAFLLRSASFGGRGRSASFGEHIATEEVRSPAPKCFLNQKLMAPTECEPTSALRIRPSREHSGTSSCRTPREESLSHWRSSLKTNRQESCNEN